MTLTWMLILQSWPSWQANPSRRTLKVLLPLASSNVQLNAIDSQQTCTDASKRTGIPSKTIVCWVPFNSSASGKQHGNKVWSVRRKTCTAEIVGSTMTKEMLSWSSLRMFDAVTSTNDSTQKQRFQTRITKMVQTKAWMKVKQKKFKQISELQKLTLTRTLNVRLN